MSLHWHRKLISILNLNFMRVNAHHGQSTLATSNNSKDNSSKSLFSKQKYIFQIMVCLYLVICTVRTGTSLSYVCYGLRSSTFCANLMLVKNLWHTLSSYLTDQMHHKLKPQKLSCVYIFELEKGKTCSKSLSKTQDKFRITGMKSHSDVWPKIFRG